MRDREERYQHPSYGLVQFSRIQNGPGKNRLFGSSIANHITTIRLRIRRGEEVHHLSEDHYFTNELPLIEVEMSSAQFAELLTSMNMGSGVPCTIRYLNGEQVDDPPEHPIEAERVRDGFAATLKEFIISLKSKSLEINRILEKKSINKADKETIRWVLQKTIMEVESNAPFVLKQFQRATDKLVTAGKAEIDSFVTGMIHKTGLQQLQAMKSEPMLLESGDEDTCDKA